MTSTLRPQLNTKSWREPGVCLWSWDDVTFVHDDRGGRITAWPQLFGRQWSPHKVRGKRCSVAHQASSPYPAWQGESSCCISLCLTSFLQCTGMWRRMSPREAGLQLQLNAQVQHCQSRHFLWKHRADLSKVSVSKITKFNFKNCQSSMSESPLKSQSRSHKYKTDSHSFSVTIFTKRPKEQTPKY